MTEYDLVYGVHAGKSVALSELSTTDRDIYFRTRERLHVDDNEGSLEIVLRLLRELPRATSGTELGLDVLANVVALQHNGSGKQLYTSILARLRAAYPLPRNEEEQSMGVRNSLFWM